VDIVERMGGGAVDIVERCMDGGGGGEDLITTNIYSYHAWWRSHSRLLGRGWRRRSLSWRPNGRWRSFPQGRLYRRGRGELNAHSAH
jgi:hypothetical protein